MRLLLVKTNSMKLNEMGSVKGKRTEGSRGEMTFYMLDREGALSGSSFCAAENWTTMAC